MKKYVLVLTLFTALGLGALGAQNMEFNPTTVVVSNVAASDFEAVGYGLLVNNTNQEFNIRWTREIVEMTPGWETAVCDKIQCYFPVVNTEDFVLEPNEESRMDVHVYPGGNPGMAVVELTATNTVDTTDRVSALYYFNATPTRTVEVSRTAVKMYPNPTQGVFTISGAERVARVEIFNLAGRPVKTFVYGDGQWYNITDLPRGAYLVRLTTADGQSVVSRLMNKL